MLRSTPEKMVELDNVMVVRIGNPDLSVGLELKKSFVHLAQWVSDCWLQSLGISPMSSSYSFETLLPTKSDMKTWGSFSKQIRTIKISTYHKLQYQLSS